MTDRFVELPDSHRPEPPGAQRLGDAAAGAAVELTLGLRGPDLPHADEMGFAPLSPQDVARAYAAAPADAETVAEVLGRYGFAVEEVSLATRSMRVRGTVAQAEAAFRTKLSRMTALEQGAYRGREGAACLPAELEGIVTGVFGLDERPVVRRHAATPAAAAGPAQGPLAPADIERLYNFPPGDAAGARIVIAEFGGGYFADDLAAYCARAGRPQPQVTLVPIGVTIPTLAEIAAMPPDQQNAAQLASVEVATDIQIAAGLCPGAELSVCFAPPSQKGVIDLLDQILKAPQPPVAVSVSWGFAEDGGQLSAAAVQAINGKLQALAMLGVTVCVSAGDDGSGAQMEDGRAHVDFPASSPFALAVGGGMLAEAGHEVVWWQAPGRRTPSGGGATGGGVSAVFDRPAWQAVRVASVNRDARDGRVVPDIAALAGPPGYEIMLLGAPFTNGGTSAATPVWAALVARMAQHLPAAKQRRFLTRLLYAAAGAGTVGAAGCRPITSGDNASHPHPGVGYAAGPGYSAVAGWGAPDGQALLAALAAI
jgi:kumamolisin